jgi:hypothetical protein
MEIFEYTKWHAIATASDLFMNLSGDESILINTNHFTCHLELDSHLLLLNGFIIYLVILFMIGMVIVKIKIFFKLIFVIFFVLSIFPESRSDISVNSDLAV